LYCIYFLVADRSLIVGLVVGVVMLFVVVAIIVVVVVVVLRRRRSRSARSQRYFISNFDLSRLDYYAVHFMVILMSML